MRWRDSTQASHRRQVNVLPAGAIDQILT